MGWSPQEMARYLQFTPPLHGLLQGFAIAPLVSRLGIRGASELGTLVPALCYPLWGSAWLVPGKLRRAAVYGTVQVLGVNTWMVMSKLGTEARMMNALPEGVGKGELSAAISSLQMAVNVSSAGNLDILDLGISDYLTPKRCGQVVMWPVAGRLFAFFMRPPAWLPSPLRLRGSGNYVIGGALFCVSWLCLRTAPPEPSAAEVEG